MPQTRTTTTLRIFLASPSDVTSEREIASRVVNEVNTLNSDNDEIHMELVKWETHSFPDAGSYAQAVVNAQMFQDIDIFLGIMWARFGTPTEAAGSGTEEEFLLAKKQYNDESDSISIMIYFKDTPLSPSKIDVEQYAKVENFKTSLRDEGVYYATFNTVEDFEKLLRMHLTLQRKKWLGKLSDGKSNLATLAYESNVISSNDDEDDLGLLDFVEIYEERFSELNGTMKKIKVYTEEFATSMEKATAEANSLPKDQHGRTNKKDTKKVIASFSNEMKGYAQRLETEVKIFNKAFDEGFEAFLGAVNLSNVDDDHEKEQLKGLCSQLDEMRGSFLVIRKNIGNTQSEILAWPKLTRDLNRSKKLVNSVYNEFKTILEEKDNLIKQASDTLGSL